MRAAAEALSIARQKQSCSPACTAAPQTRCGCTHAPTCPRRIFTSRMPLSLGSWYPTGWMSGAGQGKQDRAISHGWSKCMRAMGAASSDRRQHGARWKRPCLASHLGAAGPPAGSGQLPRSNSQQLFPSTVVRWFYEQGLTKGSTAYPRGCWGSSCKPAQLCTRKGLTSRFDPPGCCGSSCRSLLVTLMVSSLVQRTSSAKCTSKKSSSSGGSGKGGQGRMRFIAKHQRLSARPAQSARLGILRHLLDVSRHR